MVEGDEMADPAAPDAEADAGTRAIAGHPLVRELRRTAEREVWVAAGAAGVGVELHRSMPGEESLLAREVEALLLAGHPHLVPILDVATDDGVVVVRPLLPRSLADWLRDRGSPEPGEAVTALAPIAAALGALHAVGATTAGVTARQVRIDADGAPLLAGEGARIEAARPTTAWREASDGVAADADGWRALAETVLDACGATLPDAVAHRLTERDLAAAAEALLAAWPALPLVLEPAAAPASVQPARARRRERAAGLEAVWARAALLLERAVERIPRPRGARLRLRLAGVRPRFWVVGVGGAAALALALLVPAPGAADGQDPAAGGIETAAVPPTPTPTPAQTPQQPSPAPIGGGSLAGGPVAGAALLLAEREACLDADDAACLVGLHEPDSPQLAAASPWRMPADGRLELVQRLGDAWLLRVVSERAPASVLVMSTEAGWTLRDAWPG